MDFGLELTFRAYKQRYVKTFYLQPRDYDMCAHTHCHDSISVNWTSRHHQKQIIRFKIRCSNKKNALVIILMNGLVLEMGQSTFVTQSTSITRKEYILQAEICCLELYPLPWNTLYDAERYSLQSPQNFPNVPLFSIFFPKDKEWKISNWKWKHMIKRGKGRCQEGNTVTGVRFGPTGN